MLSQGIISSKTERRLKRLLALIPLMLLSACSDQPPRDKLIHLPHSTFYMKVIDQDGLPVSGVEAQILHGGNYFVGSNLGEGTYFSDDSGILAVEFDDRQVTVKNISKPGYRINWAQISFAFSEERLYQVPAQGDFWPVDMKRFSKNLPFVIDAWRLDPAERAASCINGRFFRRMHADGRAYGFHLPKTTRSGRGEKSADPDIWISFSRDYVENLPPQDFLRNELILQTDWRYTIEAVNGGIQEIERETVYKKTPPKTGYGDRWTLNRHTFLPRSSEYGGAAHEDDRHFFLHLDDDVLARISVRFKPMGSAKLDCDNGEIIVDYSINTDGSGYVQDADGRNLQRNTTQYRNATCVDTIKR